MLVALTIVVVGGLFYCGKLGNFKLKKKGKELELDITAPDSNTRNLPPTPQPSQEIKISLNDENYKKELEEKLENHHEKIEKLVKQITNKDPETDKEINVLNREIAALQNKLTNTEQALKENNAAFAEFEKSLESEKIKNAVSEDQLALAQDKLKAGDSSEAENLYTRILQEAETKTEAGAEAAFQLAKLAKVRIDYLEALRLFEKAVQLAPENSIYLNEAGTMLNTLANFDKAIEYFEKALASNLKTFGAEHPGVAIRWNNLGLAWKSKGEYNKAIEYHKKALASNLKTFDADHPDVAIEWWWLGTL